MSIINDEIHLKVTVSLGHQASALVLNLVNLEVVGFFESSYFGHHFIHPVLVNLDVIFQQL